MRIVLVLTQGVPPNKGNVSGPFEDQAEADVISPVSLDLGLCGGGEADRTLSSV